MRYALLTAPVLAFFAGMSCAYGLFVPNPIMLWSFIYIIPLGICVGLVAQGLGELDRAAHDKGEPKP